MAERPERSGVQMSIRVDRKGKGKVVKEIHRQGAADARHIKQYLSKALKGAEKGTALAEELKELVDRIDGQIGLMESGKKAKLELHLRERSVAALRIATSPRVRKSIEAAASAISEAEKVYDSLRRENKATKAA
jgi:hypothetical protein